MYESTISFTLDTVCPWTYLAKRRLDKALAEVRSDPETSSKVHFTVLFRPYQLNPDFPPGDGADKYAWYRDTKYDGSEERMRMYTTLMTSYGAAEGIAFKFGGTVANTLDAHRVLQYFQEEKGPVVADALVNALYRAYFEEERHPSSDDTLVRACVEAGVDEREAKAVVEDKSEGLVDVKSAIQRQGADGIDSVPNVMFEGKRRDITLVGAKEIAEYVKTLRTIAKESG